MFTLAALLLLLAPLTSFGAEGDPRSCTVKEVIKGGMYVYIRCQEKGADIWLASVARTFKDDEVISFVDAPPMTNFYSKQLNRLFPEVIFTDIIPPGAGGK
jgi:hypothetical protein